MRHHRSLVFFRFGLTPLNAGVASFLLFSLFSVLVIVGELVEDGDEEEGLGVEDRESESEIPLGTLESVVRAERATERRLLVSVSGFGE